ncbi:MAG: tRNA uridine-5-carboxymethylaminomethyl(34) synthesis GTPase MnmE [Silvanigrellales bacterium]|nr:tRNA uridine-5-carboxymethylaminomethyl(34) synthesis GTPase MnmE [Silvanigrellales bacterium]
MTTSTTSPHETRGVVPPESLAGDVFFALSVPPGRAALHLHRISGPGCRALVAPALRTPSGTRLCETTWVAGVRYLHLVDESDGLIDDVVVTTFVAPHSYTGDDTIEIATHGNPLLSARLQQRLRQLGLRDARPGEFTQRAFLNGKLDLAQAEAVNLLIHAETAGGIELARAVTEGSLSRETRALRERLVKALAHIEAHIDFSDDEVGVLDADAFLPELEALAKNLEEVAATYERGRKVRDGVRLALCGAPNAGKSTLFNALLQSDRAIVTDIPGTTRDVLEERFALSGRDFVVCDTAGLRDTDDVVEKMGVERSRRAAREADVLCFVGDGSRTDFELELELRVLLKNDVPVLIALTKADLWRREGMPFEPEPELQTRLVRTERLRDRIGLPQGRVVATAPDDVHSLEAALIALYDTLTAAPGARSSAVLISARQRDAIAKAKAEVQEAIALLRTQDYPEKAASALLAANRSLVSVVGEISADDVLGSIFATFCIGK